MVAADLRWLSMKLPPSFFFATSDAAIHELDEELTTSNYSTAQCSRKIALSLDFMKLTFSQFYLPMKICFYDIHLQCIMSCIKFPISNFHSVSPKHSKRGENLTLNAFEFPSSHFKMLSQK